MKQMKSIALCLLLLSPAAMALTLDEARQQGRVGETLSGYISARAQDSETQALVERINQGRQQQYQALAQRNNTTVAEVGRIAGQKLIERAAAAGQYVRGINGQWMKKDP
ncbi:amine metabolic protein ydbL [Erwinia typographi]|uniref:Amine metabolic protein ydbL n=1 Tax=Erwinia typographi TaxID=371042 RepID=A0A0A3YU35_9GAMM|nr:YdbL family protein [Erwinia typographi]KGT88881.1 amine metabolic protein ydbL [Erwinia typographi]